MIEYGFGVSKDQKNFRRVVDFARDNSFDLLQVWYTSKDGLEVEEALILECNFPIIIHAVLEVDEIIEHHVKILEILKRLKLNELIIHPKGNQNMFPNLVFSIGQIIKTYNSHNIKLFLENNSKLNPLFSPTSEIREMFDQNPDLNLLLDLAHIDDYEHLKDMIAVKYPGILHVSDRHLEVIHEHLPIGQGNIDFRKIFTEILPEFNGKIIFELSNNYEEMIRAKEVISKYLEIPSFAKATEGKLGGHYE